MGSTSIPVQAVDNIFLSQSSILHDPQNSSFQNQISSTNQSAVENHLPFLTERLLRVSINEHTAEHRSRSLTEKLLRVNPSYDAGANRPYEPDTFVDIMKELSSWLTDISGDSQSVYWLSGETGVAEYTIASMFATHCNDCNTLDALFLVNQNNAMTMDPCVFLPNILQQLHHRFPQVSGIIQRFLRARPSVTDNWPEDMAPLLSFSMAITSAATMFPSRAILIVIQAFDETDTRRLRDFAKIFSRAVVKLPRNAKVFILSRGENAVAREFEPLRRLRRVKSRFLMSKQSIEEISEFMEMKLRAILGNCEMAQTGWDSQGDDRMKELSSRASGLYIWAETALKFLQVEFENSGNAAHVEELLDVLTNISMDDMNTLYLTILRRTCKPGDLEYHYFHRIIGAILVRQAPLSIDDIEGFLHLENRASSSHLDVLDFVRQYRTLLVNNTSEIDECTIPSLYKHFAHFITSEWAQEFRVYQSAAHGELVIRCIHYFEKMLNYLTCAVEDGSKTAYFPAQFWYASRCWQSHLTRMVQLNTNDGTECLGDYDTPDILTGNDLQNLPTFESLENSRPTTDSDGRHELHSVAVSHFGTQVAVSCKGEGVIFIWDGKTGLKRMSLIGHEDGVESVIFSPDDTKLVSASHDTTARIWDTRTGRELLVLRGHVACVNHAAFSHDGGRVVTCSEDQTLRSWNSQTGEQLNEFRGHGQAVQYFVISPDDQRIASVSFDDVLRVWEFNSGNLISQMQLDHDGAEFDTGAISFCPDLNHIISHQSVQCTTLWDLRSGMRLNDADVSAFAAIDFVKGSDWDSNSTNEDDSDQNVGQEANAAQGSTYGYITIPRADQRLNHLSLSPQLFTFEMDEGTIYGIVEHGQGVWGYDTLFPLSPRIRFVAGAITMR